MGCSECIDESGLGEVVETFALLVCEAMFANIVFWSSEINWLMSNI
jgi:hypothetical protein